MRGEDIGTEKYAALKALVKILHGWRNMFTPHYTPHRYLVAWRSKAADDHQWATAGAAWAAV